MAESAIESATPVQRFVLLAVVDLASREESPVHSYDVKRTCESLSEVIEGELFAGVSRQEVINALTALEEDGLLREERVESPVGKGRPAYELAVPAGTVLDALGDDGRVERVVERVRERRD